MSAERTEVSGPRDVYIGVREGGKGTRRGRLQVPARVFEKAPPLLRWSVHLSPRPKQRPGPTVTGFLSKSTAVVRIIR